MYLPTQVEAEREEITARFTEYGEQMRNTLGDKYLLKTHWAKIELEGNLERRKKQVERLKTAYGQENFRVFRDLRRKFDCRVRAFQSHLLPRDGRGDLLYRVYRLT